MPETWENRSDDWGEGLDKGIGKMPLNAVTIRGEATDEAPRNRNLTIARLWIGNDTIPDAPRRFNPEKRRGPQWDKPITLTTTVLMLCDRIPRRRLCRQRT